MHIGFLSLPLSGHLYPMTALARTLQARGHEVSFFGVPDSEALVRAAGLNFVSCGEQEYPPGAVASTWKPIASLHGLAVLNHALTEIHPAFLSAAFRHLPGKLGEAGIEALVVDAAFAFVELVAISVNLPFVQIWNVLPFDPTGTTPPCMFSWPYEMTPEAQLRNAEGVKRAGAFFGPAAQVAAAYAKERGLAIDWTNPGATSSRRAILAQTIKEFDYPGIPWPPHFHYAGPFHDGTSRTVTPFAWEKLDGRPLVYASLGTLVNGLPQLFRTILGAAAQLPEVQFVFSTGSNVSGDVLDSIPSNTVIVSAAPQIELLQRAALCLTHAGLNTVQEALAAGVPLVALPIGYDQPGVAARIEFHGIGRFVPFEDLTVNRLLRHIREVLSDPSFREKALSFQKLIRETHGLKRAADIVEQAFSEELLH